MRNLFKSMFHHLFVMKRVLLIRILAHNLNQHMMHIQVHMSIVQMQVLERIVALTRQHQACLILKLDLQVFFL
jgi:hypothetical protein